MLFQYEFNKMTRDEIVAELDAWANKANAKIEEAVEQRTKEEREYFDQKLTEFETLAEDMTMQDARDLLTKAKECRKPVFGLFRSKRKIWQVEYHAEELRKALWEYEA